MGASRGAAATETVPRLREHIPRAHRLTAKVADGCQRAGSASPWLTAGAHGMRKGRRTVATAKERTAGEKLLFRHVLNGPFHHLRVFPPSVCVLGAQHSFATVVLFAATVQRERIFSFALLGDCPPQRLPQLVASSPTSSDMRQMLGRESAASAEVQTLTQCPSITHPPRSRCPADADAINLVREDGGDTIFLTRSCATSSRGFATGLGLACGLSRSHHYHARLGTTSLRQRVQAARPLRHGRDRHAPVILAACASCWRPLARGLPRRHARAPDARGRPTCRVICRRA
jgi:hypothetical protein